MHAPLLEAVVSDAGASCKINEFKSVSGVLRNMCHGAVLNVFTIAEREALESRTAIGGRLRGVMIRCCGYTESDR